MFLDWMDGVIVASSSLVLYNWSRLMAAHEMQMSRQTDQAESGQKHPSRNAISEAGENGTAP